MERAFSDPKSIAEVRPVFPGNKRRITRHIFCNSPALHLKIAFQKASEEQGLKLPWDEVLGDLKAIREVKSVATARPYHLRIQFRGVPDKVFQTVGPKTSPTLQILKDTKL